MGQAAAPDGYVSRRLIFDRSPCDAMRPVAPARLVIVLHDLVGVSNSLPQFAKRCAP